MRFQPASLIPSRLFVNPRFDGHAVYNCGAFAKWLADRSEHVGLTHATEIRVVVFVVVWQATTGRTSATITGNQFIAVRLIMNVA